MKRWVLVVCLLLLVIAGCTKQPSRSVTPKTQQQLPPINEQAKQPKKEVPQYVSSSQTFHFVVDWLNSSTIMFVEKHEQTYQLKTFQVNTGKTDVLYEDSAIISDVMIHPSKEQILIHTSTNPSSAIIKILQLDGTITDSIELASSEVAIEWNTLDPAQIVFTTFYEDWSFDLFYYNGHNQSLEMLSLPHPFPKWLDSHSLLYVSTPGHALDGGEVYKYDVVEKRQHKEPISNIVYLDTFKETLLTVEMKDETKALYTLRGSEGKEFGQWELPAVSNYSEWYISDVSWISERELYTVAGAVSGQLDNLQEKFLLVHWKDGKLNQIPLQGKPHEIFRCSPDGQYCIRGVFGEIILSTVDGEERRWLIIQDE